ncbi:MAG: hypothetical protein Q7V57_00290 [Actinomycetota bacterium]|nr:hypothetical protein [Actinomycetota bacterium]
MCAGCYSTVDGYIMGAVGLGAAIEVGVCRVKAMFDAQYAAQRHVLVYERNAAFCEYMGLDPLVVLGPKPAPLPVAHTSPGWSPSFGSPALAVP